MLLKKCAMGGPMFPLLPGDLHIPDICSADLHRGKMRPQNYTEDNLNDNNNSRKSAGHCANSLWVFLFNPQTMFTRDYYNLQHRQNDEPPKISISLSLDTVNM